MKAPNSNEYAPFYAPYIKAVDLNKSISENLSESFQQAMKLLIGISKEKQTYQYAKGKWTIKELVLHLMDAEMVFNYRALRFARNDQTELPGFEENDYVRYSDANNRDYQDLLQEFTDLRKVTMNLYKNMEEDILQRGGNASGNFMSVRAIGYITSGHLLHHLQVIKERYL